MARNAIFIGVKGEVLALDPSTGTEIWRTVLRSGHFVNVTLQGGKVLATTRGEIFALDPASGHILWNNELQGLGWGFITIAGADSISAMSAYQAQQNDGGAAAAAVTAG